MGFTLLLVEKHDSASSEYVGGSTYELYRKQGEREYDTIYYNCWYGSLCWCLSISTLWSLQGALLRRCYKFTSCQPVHQRTKTQLYYRTSLPSTSEELCKYLSSSNHTHRTQFILRLRTLTEKVSRANTKLYNISHLGWFTKAATVAVFIVCLHKKHEKQISYTPKHWGNKITYTWYNGVDFSKCVLGCH